MSLEPRVRIHEWMLSRMICLSSDWSNEANSDNPFDDPISVVSTGGIIPSNVSQAFGDEDFGFSAPLSALVQVTMPSTGKSAVVTTKPAPAISNTVSAGMCNTCMSFNLKYFIVLKLFYAS